MRACCILYTSTHDSSCAPSAPAQQVWDLSSRKVIRSYEGHGGGVNTVLFHPDGTCIASGSTDGSLKVRTACLPGLSCTQAGRS